MIGQAVSLEELESGNWSERLLPPDTAVRHLPKIAFSAEATRRLLLGQRAPAAGAFWRIRRIVDSLKSICVSQAPDLRMMRTECISSAYCIFRNKTREIKGQGAELQGGKVARRGSKSNRVRFDSLHNVELPTRG